MLNAVALQLLVDLVQSGNSQKQAESTGIGHDKILNDLLELNKVAPDEWVRFEKTHAAPTAAAIELVARVSPQLHALNKLQRAIER